MRLLGLFFGCAVTGAFAEIFEFANIPIPENLTLDTYYVFHVRAPVAGTGVDNTAAVSFKNFEAKWSDRPAGLKDWKSIQVSLVPWSKFYTHIDTSGFCSPDRHLKFKTDGKGVFVFNPETQKEVTIPITATDKYILMVTNCGDRTGATLLTGQVAVKQPHGHLPSNKIPTFYWCGWITLVNALVFFVWIIAMASRRSTLLYVQKMVAVLAMTAFIEGAADFYAHMEWNNTGSRNIMIFGVTILFHCTKYALTLRLLLETSAGSGIVMKKLPPFAECKTNSICVIFLMMQWIWKVSVSYKQSLMINPVFLMIITAPGTLFCLILFTWIFQQFRSLSAALQFSGSQAMKIFLGMRLVVVGTFFVATLVLLIQLADMWLDDTPWNLQWVPYDAAPHAAYTLFLLALMMVWWPRADNWKLEYTDQVNQEEADAAGGEPPMVKAEQIGANEEKL